MQSTTLIDWLAITYQWDVIPISARGLDKGASDRLLDWLNLFSGSFSLDKARYGYVMGLKARDSVTVYLSEPGSAQGVHVVYPGSSLTPVRAIEALKHMSRNQGKCTRIDLSVDIKDSTLTPDIMRQEYEAGRVDGYKRTWALLTGTNGATLYVGSRSSDKYLRCYDKAAQMGEAGAWMRVELECKGDAAKAGAWLMHDTGTYSIPEIINGFTSFHHPEWKRAMGEARNGSALTGEKKMTDTRKWLLQQIAPMIARLYKDNPTLYNEFTNVVLGMVDNYMTGE
jgi:DNA relaxase NicK